MLCLMITLKSLAQEVVLPAGNNATGSNGSVSYSFGQLFYNSAIGSSGSTIEGVQQPYEISVISGIEENDLINLTVSVYPNPANNYLNLHINEFDITGLSFRIFDMQGKLLKSEKISNNLTIIDMNNFVPATYLVKIYEDTRGLKTFKVIKN